MDEDEKVNTYYMEGRPLVLPSLFEGPTAIGDLYDCRTSKSLGLNLFGKNLTSDQLQANIMNGHHFNFTRIRSAKDNQKRFRVSGDVSLELIMGLMKVNDIVDNGNSDLTYPVEHQLMCHYTLDTFSIRALPSSREIMDTLVVEKMIKGYVKATLVVVGCYLGAEAIASIRIRENTLTHESDLGNLFKTLTTGPLTGSQKAFLEALDTSQDFETTINFYSKPKLKNEAPATLKDMFAAIDSISSLLETEKYPSFARLQYNASKLNVIGLPLTFHLVPISLFFEEPQEKLYHYIKVDVLESIIGLLISLKDFQSIGCLKKIILEQEPRLQQAILDNNIHAVAKITAREQELQKLSKSHFSSIVETFINYKLGTVNQQHLLNLIRRIDQSINVISIFQEVVEYASQGLLDIGLEDTDEKKGQLKIFTDTNDIHIWYQTQNSIKILFRTLGQKIITASQVTRLHKICKPLSESGLEVGIAVPACSDNHCNLSVKIGDSEIIYDEEDAEFVTQILHLVINEASSSSMRLHTIYASLNGIKLPLSRDLGKLPNMIKVFADLKSIQISDSYLTLRDFALLKDNRWKLVIDLDALDSATLAITKFRFLNTQLSDLKIDWIVGKFGFESPKHSNSPLLFVFKNETIEYICHDNVDILLLTQVLHSTATDIGDTKKISHLLKPELCSTTNGCIYKERVDFGIKVVQLFSNFNHLQTEDPDCPQLEGLNITINNHIEELQNLLRCFLNQDWYGVISTVAAILSHQFPELQSVLSASTSAYPTTPTSPCFADTAQVTKCLKNFLTSNDPMLAKIEILRGSLVSPNSNNKFYDVEKFMDHLIKYDHCPEPLKRQLLSCQEVSENQTRMQKIQDIIEQHMESVAQNKYLDLVLFIRLLEQPTSTNFLHDFGLFEAQLLPKLLMNYVHFDTNKYPDVIDRLGSLVRNNDYYGVSHLLSQVKYNENELFCIWNDLEALVSLRDAKGLCQLLQKLSFLKLSPEFYQGFFADLKIAYLLETNMDSSELAHTLKHLHCSNSKIPNYIPTFLRSAIENIIEKDDDTIDFPDIITTIDEGIKLFQRIEALDIVPDNFSTLLRDSVTSSVEFKAGLEDAQALKYWSEERQLFTDTWDVETIRQVSYQLVKWKESHSKSSQENTTHQEELFLPFSIPTANKDHLASLQNDNAKFKVPEPDEEQYRSLETTAFESLPAWWTKLMGSGPAPKRIDNQMFLQISRILPEPQLRSCDEGFILGFIPYFLQRLKMWGVYVLQPDHLEKLNLVSTHHSQTNYSIPEITGGRTKLLFNIPLSPPPIHDPIQLDSNEMQSCPLGRIDILSCLNGLCTRLVFQDLLRIISQFPASLPLILQDISGNSVCLLSLLKSVKVKWETQPGVVIHNQLFVHPFRLVTAIRVGPVSLGDSGKSTILNQVLSNPNMFSSFSNPGAQNGIPHTLAGSAEMVVLLPETCSSLLWEEIVKAHYTSASSANQVLLLANLHGDALELPGALELLLELSATFIVFFMPCSIDVLQKRCAKVESMLRNNEDIIHVLVDPKLECQRLGISAVNTSQLTNGVTLKVVRSLIGQGISKGVPKEEFEFRNSLPKNITALPDIVTIETKQLMDVISKLGCGGAKSCFKLQKLNSKYDQDFVNKAIKIWKGDAHLRNVIEKFICVLQLPIPARMIAFAHLDSAMSSLSYKESILIRVKLSKLQEQKRRTLSLEGSAESMTEQKRLIDQIRVTTDALNEMSLGMEHLYRELGKLYQVTQILASTVQSGSIILTLPTSYAELLISGHAIEILDGDSGDMCGPWLESICHSLCQVHPNLRIFSLSIIGLQSSGKSTLLNALFACKFAVSVGRCTRGLFMRLVFLEKSLVDELNIDAILLIDTEGLGAPERLTDPDAERKDRLLATFAISVSNLTLINVLGESLRDLTDILQIVIVTMARLEKADICPDILMVQHLSERDNSKVSKGMDEFCQALDHAVAITDTNDLKIGVRSSKSLKKLEYRVKNGEFLKSFSPYKDGASANAPPSAEYHKDVVDLYKIILESCRQLKRPQSFHKWHELIQEYWAAVSIQDFSLRFKNIQEVQEFIERGSAIAKVKEAVDAAFRVHRESAEAKLRHKVNQLASSADGIQNWEREKERELNIIREELKWIPSNCDPPCAKCSDAVSRKDILFREVEGKSSQLNTEATINIYIQKIRDSSMKHLIQMVEAARIKHGWSCEFDAKIASVLVQTLKKEKNMSEEKRKEIVEEVWSWLQQEVSKAVRVASAERRICEEVRKEYENAGDFLKRFRGKVDFLKPPNLREMKAIDYSKFEKGINVVMHIAGYQPQHSKLNMNQVVSLERSLDGIPRMMLKNHGTDHYEDGMIKTVRSSIDRVLNDFMKVENVKLYTGFKWEAHAYAIFKFVCSMNIAEEEWNKNNNPYYILCQNEVSYKKKIYIRLTHGFGYDAEARIIGEELLKAIRKRAQKQGDRSHIDLIKSTSWLSCSESVRLRFYSSLAQDVETGSSKQRALKYFAHPKSGIESWFKSQVNFISDEAGKRSFNETVDSEFDRVKQEIQNQMSTQGVQNFIENYFAQVGDISYNPDVDFEGGNTTDLQLLQTVIQDKLEEGKEHLKHNISLAIPYDQQEIRSLLGCTEHCYWCGSLCWGQAGHEENMDSTKKHHASHQPRGLIGTHEKNSKHLISDTCDNTAENHIHHYSKFPDPGGVTWTLIKAHEDFANWTFNAHNKTEFNDLMKWFYVELHNDIASSLSLLPARDEDLSKFGFNNLVALDHILSTIKSKI